MFPSGTIKGNSEETMHELIGGDADDYITATYGIPSITAELGDDLYFIEQWVIKTRENAYNIVNTNQQWLDYIFINLPDFAKRLT